MKMLPLRMRLRLSLELTEIFAVDGCIVAKLS